MDTPCRPLIKDVRTEAALFLAFLHPSLGLLERYGDLERHNANALIIEGVL
jgi:hypothetical protein